MCSTAGRRRRSCGASDDGSVVSSKRGRPVAHASALREAGYGLKVMELQGPLHFGSAEAFSRAFADECVGASHLVLDLSRVTSVDQGALPVISATVRAVEGRVTVVIAGEGVESVAVADSATYRSLDIALERCEDEILRAPGCRGGERHVDAGRSGAAEAAGARRGRARRRGDVGGAVRSGQASLPGGRCRRLDLLRRVRSGERRLGGGRASRAAHDHRARWMLR